MQDQRFSRFKSANWFGVNKKILIGGCGGTGSWVSIFLSRLGEHQLFLYDDDKYENVNLAGQFVFLNDIGYHKSTCIAQKIKDFSNLEVKSFVEKYVEDSPIFDIAFACFDNMQARKLMFEKWVLNVKDHDNPEECLFVDLRLVAESFVIIFVQGHKIEQIEYYKENLFTDSEVIPVPCSLKQTTHTAALCASMTIGLFSNWISNNVDNIEILCVPYQTEFFIPNFLLTTMNV